MTKAVNSTESTVQWPFKLESIAKAAAPGGAEGMWHRYVISQGTNMIDGTRAGTHEEVAMRLRELVERLNERREGRTRPKGRR